MPWCGDSDRAEQVLWRSLKGVECDVYYTHGVGRGESQLLFAVALKDEVRLQLPTRNLGRQSFSKLINHSEHGIV